MKRRKGNSHATKYLFRILYEHINDLSSPTKNKQARCDDERADDHEGPASAPFGSRSVSNDTNEGLDNQARKRAGDPDKRGLGFGEAQLEQVWGAIYIASQKH